MEFHRSTLGYFEVKVPRISPTGVSDADWDNQSVALFEKVNTILDFSLLRLEYTVFAVIYVAGRLTIIRNNNLAGLHISRHV